MIVNSYSETHGRIVLPPKVCAREREVKVGRVGGGAFHTLEGPALELRSYLQAMASIFRSRSEQGLAGF